MSSKRNNIDGAWILNKHQGVTSAVVVQKLKNRLKLQKVGHAGTLDPLATGVLLILSGQATRAQDLFSNERKVYSGHIQFGLETDTNDIDGKVVASEEPPQLFERLSDQEIIDSIKEKFSGLQRQVPPQISALKIGGIRSYNIARRGEIAELSGRTVDIKFQDLQLTEDRKLFFRVDVSKGTYIRSLARDIGYAFETFACVESLHRERVGRWSVENSSELRAIGNDSSLSFVPMLELLNDMPRIDVDSDTARRLRNGDFYLLRELAPENSNSQFATIVSDGSAVSVIELNENSHKWQFRMVFN